MFRGLAILVAVVVLSIVFFGPQLLNFIHAL